jgi:serine/threonine protein kinase
MDADKNKGQVYACKNIGISYLTNFPPEKSKKRWNSIVREVVILEMIDSPHVIKFIEFVRTSNNFYLFIEYVNGGSLQNLLDIKGCFPEVVARKILRQIVAGCTALYAQKVVHRDLKLDNILISFPSRGEKLTR